MRGSRPFDKRLNAYFNSTEGAYSKTTSTEGDKKRQYNVKSGQTEILERVLGHELLQRKGKGAKKYLEKAGIDFTSKMRVYPSGQLIEVTLVYPKLDPKKKNELRIYFSGATFKANAHDYIVIYVRDGEPWIGAISEIALNIISAGSQEIFDANPRDFNLEEEIDEYQALINKPPELVAQQNKSFAWKRDAKIAKAALKKSKFKCELFPEMPTFTARSTGMPFMEVHHLLPMKHQSSFSENLDNIHNLCVLNPTAHRLVHHAEFGELRPHLRKLFSKREAYFSDLKVSWEDLESIYQ